MNSMAHALYARSHKVVVELKLPRCTRGPARSVTCRESAQEVGALAATVRYASVTVNVRDHVCVCLCVCVCCVPRIGLRIGCALPWPRGAVHIRPVQYSYTVNLYDRRKRDHILASILFKCSLSEARARRPAVSCVCANRVRKCDSESKAQ